MDTGKIAEIRSEIYILPISKKDSEEMIVERVSLQACSIIYKATDRELNKLKAGKLEQWMPRSREDVTGSLEFLVSPDSKMLSSSPFSKEMDQSDKQSPVQHRAELVSNFVETQLNNPGTKSVLLIVDEELFTCSMGSSTLQEKLAVRDGVYIYPWNKDHEMVDGSSESISDGEEKDEGSNSGVFGELEFE